MRLFDTAFGDVVEIAPADNHLSIYVCGITPYDVGHLGHAFIYHVFDLIAAAYRRRGVAVTMTRNVTDVDDDIMRTARERGRKWRELAEENVALFEQDMSALGIAAPDRLPRASEYIEEIVDWIAAMLESGRAYANEGYVYFDTQSDGNFGALARLDSVAMLRLLGERGGDPQDGRKHHPLDFVVWQPSLADEPSWTAPFGTGRPGWHIECSVMATANAKPPLDIHGGGEDLIYPHHESELAQARAVGIDPFVRHWVHVPYVMYQGEKMSKSLGNCIWARDLIAERGGAVVRMMLNGQHYRQSWEYRPELLDQAENRYRSYMDAAAGPGRIGAGAAAEFGRAVEAALEDDLNTPRALEILDGLAITFTQSAISGTDVGLSGGEVFPELLAQLGIGSVAAV